MPSQYRLGEALADSVIGRHKHKQSRTRAGLAQRMIDLAGLPLVAQTSSQSLNQSVAAVSSLRRMAPPSELQFC
jgi:hypothetical protein